MDISMLEKFKVDGEDAQPRVKPKFKPTATVGDFLTPKEVIAFDQSLNHTGWIRLKFHGGVIKWENDGVISLEKVTSPDPTIKGFTQSFEKLVALKRDVSAVLDMFQVDNVVYEEPPFLTTLYRTDSSLLAASVIYVAARERGIPVKGIHPMKARKVVLDNSKATKEEVRQKMLSVVEGCPQKLPHHVTDAALLAVCEFSLF